ncbi:MAG: NUDIX domain-containing protein [Lachnospiraceae bacterium]|nr:NUDIX domain-containing protein [Lachnospiraceae bacterium]
MKELFTIDTKDYNPEGRVHRRPSARAIIEKDGRFLVMYSQKYRYYKFPGGGIEAGETPQEALVREVREESGYEVIPGTIEEFGSVLRRNRDAHDSDAIFEQENYYYYAEIGGSRVQITQEDYEIEEGFVPMWVDNLYALSRANRGSLRSGGDPALIEREMRVFDLADEAVRARDFARDEAAAIAALGDEDYAGMLAFVRSVLEDHQTEGGRGANKLEFGYSRFEHTKRVLGWAKRLYEATPDKTGIRYADLMIATVFHDVGRGVDSPMGHAKAGVPITRDYLRSRGFEERRTEYICALVGEHSDKFRMADPNIDRTLLMLMEADCLDDMGALGLVMDTLIVRGRKENATFYDCYNHYCRYTVPMQKECPMVTPEGKAFWDEKTEIAERFVSLIRRDISLFD